MGYFDDIKNKTPEPSQHLSVVRPEGENLSRYAAAALKDEARIVAEAPQGSRNHTLNKAYFNMGRHVSAGSIDADTVRAALADAAHQAGLPADEIDTVLRDGSTSALTAAADLPRHPVPRPELPVPVVLVDTPEVGPPVNPILDWHVLFATDDDGEEWIIEPILPARRMVALYSAPKAGKSLLMLELAVAMARGTDVIGTTVDRPYRVLYVDFENDPRGDVRSRLEAMDVGPADLGNLCYLTFPSIPKFDTAQGALDLLRHVQHYDCEVVVIDTVSRAVGGEENDNDTWLAFYRHTGLLLKQNKIACIRLDHSGKDKEKGMRGGSAKYGDVDAVWRLTAINDTTINLECTDHRMPVPVKAMTLTRQDYPLAHVLANGDAWRAQLDAKVQEMDDLLDRLGVPTDAGEKPAGKALREAGHQVNNKALREAIKARRIRLNVPVTAPLGRPSKSAPGALPAHLTDAGISAPGAPPPLGGARRNSGTAPGAVSAHPADDPDLLVGCKSCFKPTTNAVASRNDGLCTTCHRNSGGIA